MHHRSCILVSVKSRTTGQEDLKHSKRTGNLRPKIVSNPRLLGYDGGLLWKVVQRSYTQSCWSPSPEIRPICVTRVVAMYAHNFPSIFFLPQPFPLPHHPPLHFSHRAPLFSTWPSSPSHILLQALHKPLLFGNSQGGVASPRPLIPFPC